MAFQSSTKFQWDVKVDVVGLKDLLADLRKYDKDLYKEVATSLKDAAQPLATKVGAAFPAKPPLEYWHTTKSRRGKARMPGYQGDLARRSVKPIVYSGNKFVGRNVGILRLQQMNAGGQVFDGAGTAMANPAGDRFIKNLDKRSRVKSSGDGFRSRVMFPVTKKNLPMIEDAVAKAIGAQNERIRARLVQGRLGR
jgi:hypothetical protein